MSVSFATAHLTADILPVMRGESAACRKEDVVRSNLEIQLKLHFQRCDFNIFNESGWKNTSFPLLGLKSSAKKVEVMIFKTKEGLKAKA